MRDSDRLLRRYARERSERDLEELTRRFRPLARRLALRYARNGDGLEDLGQIACLGLVKALRRYDPSRGYAFTSFAVPTILGELKRSFRDTAWSAHVPRSLQERVARLRAAVVRFEARHGRAPTVRQLARALGCDEEAVVEAMIAASSRSPVSLYSPHAFEDDDGATLLESLGGDDDGYERVDDQVSIESALPVLTDVQREVVRLRFEEELKQSDIAREIGVSQMQVSRLLRSALGRLALVANHRSAVDAPTARQPSAGVRRPSGAPASGPPVPEPEPAGASASRGAVSAARISAA